MMSRVQRSRSRLAATLALSLTLAVAVAACSDGSDELEGSTDEPITLRVAVPAFGTGESFSPIEATGTTANSMNGLVYDFLVYLNPDSGEPESGVLESFTQSPDGEYWDLKLRSGLTFSNGTPATSADLEYSLSLYQREDAYRQDFARVADHLEVVDDLTVRVYLTEPQPYLPAMFTNVTPNLAFLVSKDYYDEVGFEQATKEPIGVGPWILKESHIGDSYVYTRNENYWGEMPAANSLEVIAVPELSTQLDMLRTDQIDVITVSPDDLAQIEGEYQTIQGFAPQVRFDIWGTYEPRAATLPTHDIRVREALARAIDYDAIEGSILHGIALDRMPPRTLFGMPEVDAAKWTPYIEDLYRYDPATSRELLTQAGYPDGFDLTIYVPTTQSPLAVPLAQVVQADWKDIGVNAEIVQLDENQYVDLMGPVDASLGQVVWGWTSVLGPPASNMNWVWGLGNNSTITDVRDPTNPQVHLPELLDLITKATTEIDDTQRQAYMDELIKMGLDTYTNYVFGQVPTVMAVSKNWTFETTPEAPSSNLTPYFIRWLVPAEG